MGFKKLQITILACIFLCSCSVLQKTSKQEISDGYYMKKAKNEKSKVYVDYSDDDIKVYETVSQNKTAIVDTLKSAKTISSRISINENYNLNLLQHSLDIDLLTIPLKFRFSEKGVPPQLNSNLNASIYVGYRTDIYKIRYRNNPLQFKELNVTHFAYSIGIFNGLGNTFMSPTNTNNLLQEEYDGVVWSKGIVGILGINNFTFGISLGFDNLLDKNGPIWIYENKPWVGLALGLNLN